MDKECLWLLLVFRNYFSTDIKTEKNSHNMTGKKEENFNAA